MARVVSSIRALLIVLLFAGVAVAQHSNYQEITCPDQTGATFVTGINDAGQVVGFIVTNTGSVGFIRDKSGSCSIVNQGTNTWLMGINDPGQVVGVSFDSSFEESQAFIYYKGTATDITISGAPCQVVAFGINNKGDVVGFYDSVCDGDGGTDTGYVRHADGIVETVPNLADQAESVNANGINPKGQIVGEYLSKSGDSEKNRGFLRNANGTFAAPIDPSDATLTRATGINPQGEVVGSYFKDMEYLGAIGPCYGFFRDTDGEVTTVTHSGWEHICLMGINAAGEITGVWSPDPNAEMSSEWHAFIADKSFFGLK